MRTRLSSSSSKSKRKPVRPYILESLEPRRLLTTFTHTFGEAPTSFFYFDEFGHYDRISFFGNITAEVIGATGGGNQLINLPPAVIGPKPANVLNSLFAIYVTQSDFTGGITLAQVPDSNFNGTPVTNLPSTPYTGSIGVLTVLNDQTGPPLQTIGAPANSGEAMVGAVTNPFAPVNPAIPVLSLPVNQAFGVLPVGITTLNAGITVAAGQNLGFCYIGGPTLGQVHFGGAINTFYAGWLLTGNANGEAAVDTVTVPQNFTVAGDIQNLLVGTSIGCIDDVLLTKPIYVSGFDMFVNGTIGTVHANSGILGSINAAGTEGVPNNGADQLEIGFDNNDTNVDHFLDGVTNGNGRSGGPFGGPQVGPGIASQGIGGSAIFSNDTFAQPEYISNNYNATAGTDNSVVVDGVLQDETTNTDRVDYYAVPLLAGQTITVQVQDFVAVGSPPTNLDDLDVGVFDPDGREIASDYNAAGGTTALGGEVTQEQPFQFTADRPGVYRFAVAPVSDSHFTGTVSNIGDIPYVLSIQNVGHMTIGSIVATGDICDNPDTTDGAAGFGTQNGDLGAIVSGAQFVSSSGNTIDVENGSLRAIVATQLGNAAAATDPEISVPNGNVGLVESTTGATYFNMSAAPVPIGGDYQLVSCAGNFIGQLVADGNIGTVRAASIVGSNLLGNSIFSVDANSLSNSGIIGLIDDAGNFGSFPLGGPSITVGPDGTLKYLHVLGTTFGNALFGNSDSVGATVTYPSGTPAQVIEASGAVVTLTPVVTTAVPAPALTVTTYALDDGGSAIVNVVSSGGLTVQGSGATPNQQFGIGSVTLQGQGNAIVAGTSNLSQSFAGFPTLQIVSPPTVAATVSPLDFVVSGSTDIGVLSLNGGNFDEIADNTPGGEIVNINATSIGTLGGSGNIGTNIAHSTAAALLPNTIVSNAFPFNQQRTGVVVSGTIANVNLTNVGNLVVAGNIGNINGTISAPVFANGQINNVVLGSGGILPSGSGNLSYAGIYADGIIGNVVGTNTNIRGNVVSQTGIQSVHLQNGSIINSEIALYDATVSLSDSDNLLFGTTVLPRATGTIGAPILNLGSVVTNGTGGIIGSLIQGGDIGVVSARNGFGILQTGFDLPADGTVGSIYADGYGIRNSALNAYNVHSITANGNGSLASTATFSNQVRISESSIYDPLFGFMPNIATDIDQLLSSESTTPVNAQTPVVPGVTDTGIIEDSQFFGNHALGSVNAYSIRSASPATGGTSEFIFANSIGSITTTSLVDGMDIVTGKLGTLLIGGDLQHATLTISGRISNLTVRANLTDDSSIIAHGRNGNIGTLNVLGNVDGLIEADGGKIGNVIIHGSLTGKIQTKTLNKLVLYQNLGAGSLEITGSANLIQLVQDLGPLGNTLTVDGKVNTLKVGSNLTGNINVKGSLGKLQVGGSIVNGAKVTVGTILSLLQVGADFQAGAIVQAHQVKKVKIGGANDGTISSI